MAVIRRLILTKKCKSSNEMVTFVNNRHDFSAIDMMEKMGEDEVVSSLPHLTTWLEDLNYPVTRRIAGLFIKYGEAALPLIKDILRGNDLWHKYCVITLVVNQWPNHLIDRVKTDLVALSIEKDKDEVWIVATEALEKLDRPM